MVYGRGELAAGRIPPRQRHRRQPSRLGRFIDLFHDLRPAHHQRRIIGAPQRHQAVRADVQAVDAPLEFRQIDGGDNGPLETPVTVAQSFSHDQGLTVDHLAQQDLGQHQFAPRIVAQLAEPAAVGNAEVDPLRYLGSPKEKLPLAIEDGIGDDGREGLQMKAQAGFQIGAPRRTGPTGQIVVGKLGNKHRQVALRPLQRILQVQGQNIGHIGDVHQGLGPDDAVAGLEQKSEQPQGNQQDGDEGQGCHPAVRRGFARLGHSLAHSLGSSLGGVIGRRGRTKGKCQNRRQADQQDHRIRPDPQADAQVDGGVIGCGGNTDQCRPGGTGHLGGTVDALDPVNLRHEARGFRRSGHQGRQFGHLETPRPHPFFRVHRSPQHGHVGSKKRRRGPVGKPLEGSPAKERIEIQ